MNRFLMTAAFVGATGVISPAYATSDTPPPCKTGCGQTQPASTNIENTVGIENKVGVVVAPTIVAKPVANATAAVVLEKGAIAPVVAPVIAPIIKGSTATIEKGAVDVKAEGGDAIIEKGAVDLKNENNSAAKAVIEKGAIGGTTVTTNTVYERQNPGTSTPNVNVAAGTGCFGAQWGVSGGVSTPGASGSIGFTPAQEWNKECDESGDRKMLIVSPDPYAQGIGVKASVEKFDGIKKGFDGLGAAIKTHYADGKKLLPTSGVGMLFGIAGSPAPQPPKAGDITQIVMVDKDGKSTTVTCPEGTKWNAQTLKCERN